MTKKLSDGQKPAKSGAGSQPKIGRRQFLATSGAVAGAAMLGGLAHAKAPDVPPKNYQPEDTIQFGQWPHWMRTKWAEFPPDDPKELWIWGYTGQLSYEPGDELDLHVNTSAKQYDLEIYRDGAEWELVYKKEGLPGKKHPTPKDCSKVGCNWPVSHKLRIPRDWKSGGYVIVFRVTGKDVHGSAVKEQEAFFILRAARPKAKIALVCCTGTWIAYNDFGGGSSYTNPEVKDWTDVDAARKLGFFPELSTQRPWGRGLIRKPPGAPRKPHTEKVPPGWAVRYPGVEWTMANGYSLLSGAAGWASYDGLMARWLERNGYEVEYLTQHDLEFVPNVLDPYKCVVIVGHDEYWSHKQRDALDAWLEKGGHLARFAGNICFAVRMEDQGRRQVCYKYIADQDPVLKDPARKHLVTGFWESQIVKRPAVTTFGANGERGVYSRYGGCAPRSSGGLTVYRNHHWVFEGTDLYYADVFGEDLPLVGYESDGVAYTFKYGLPYPTGEDGAPKDLEILAMTPVTLEEEDHGNPGQMLQTLDGDWRIITQQVYGSDSEENLAKLRYGSCVMTYMPKGKGAVFCAGTTEWPYALDQHEWFSEKITHNVLKRFAS